MSIEILFSTAIRLLFLGTGSLAPVNVTISGRKKLSLWKVKEGDHPGLFRQTLNIIRIRISWSKGGGVTAIHGRVAME